jgi:methylated-DNA-[protein]-cysteine S-methyltransferase
MPETTKYISFFNSPIGILRLVASNVGLERLDFVEIQDSEMQEHPILDLARMELEEYFLGIRKVFSVPLFPSGTHFQMNVWEEVQQIGYGATRSYEDVARRLGDIKVIRAAASANGRNPLPIFIPCHRVIGKNGSLTGYSGGLWRKRMLLEIEQKEIQPNLLDELKYFEN